MSEIKFLTYPILFKWTEQELKKIPFTVNLVPFNKKIPFPVIQQKILSNDWTGLIVKEIYRLILFNLLISFNLVYLIESQ
jgi:hypothetical protein